MCLIKVACKEDEAADVLGRQQSQHPTCRPAQPEQLDGEHGAGAVHWSSEKGGGQEGQAQHSACELDPTTPETNQLDPSEKGSIVIMIMIYTSKDKPTHKRNPNVSSKDVKKIIQQRIWKVAPVFSSSRINNCHQQHY